MLSPLFALVTCLCAAQLLNAQDQCWEVFPNSHANGLKKIGTSYTEEECKAACIKSLPCWTVDFVAGIKSGTSFWNPPQCLHGYDAYQEPTGPPGSKTGTNHWRLDRFCLQKTSQRKENKKNNCQTNPCQNGASCTSTLNGFSCACAAGYTGERCQTHTASKSRGETFNCGSKNPCSVELYEAGMIYFKHDNSEYLIECNNRGDCLALTVLPPQVADDLVATLQGVDV